MPKFLEKILQTEAAKKGFTGRRADRYVYGGMNDIGAMRGNQETTKGAAMQAKHVRQMKAGTAEQQIRRHDTRHPQSGQYQTGRSRTHGRSDWQFEK